MYNVYKYLNSKPNPIKVNLEQSLFLNLHDIADTIICIPHGLTLCLSQRNAFSSIGFRRKIFV